MKIIHVVLAIACASLLTACDVKHFLPGAYAAEGKPETANVQRDGAFVNVPAASPLRKSLVVASVEPQAFAQTIDAPGTIYSSIPGFSAARATITSGMSPVRTVWMTPTRT